MGVFVIDCDKVNKGFFFGLFVVVFMFIVIVIFFVFES